MVHGQRLPYASRSPVDINADDLRRRLDQARDAQRRAYTFPQEARQAPSAAEGHRRDWDFPGGEEERSTGLLAREEEWRRALQARMGPVPPREGHPATRIGGTFPNTWVPGPSLGTRGPQVRAPMPTEEALLDPSHRPPPPDFSGQVLSPTGPAIFRRILEYPPPYIPPTGPFDPRHTGDGDMGPHDQGHRAGTARSSDPARG